MIGNHNPFVVELEHAGQQNHDYFVELKFNCTLNCSVKGYWGMNIKQLFDLLYKMDGRQFIQKMHSQDAAFTSSCIESCHVKHISQDERGNRDETITFTSTSSVLEEKLGESPRSLYPLVIITVIDPDNLHILDSEDQNQIIGLVTIVHIQDKFCENPSHIMAQYIKAASGHIFPLKSLFMAKQSERQHSQSNTTDAPLSETTSTSVEGRDSNYDDEDVDSKNDCTVCQNAPISRVLLPCRHACLCGECLRLIRRCPMCRGYIDRYFIIDSDGIGNEQDFHDDFEENGTWWERMNNKLNRWLGFS
ncbi:cell growth regulator with RING finger domain protein 1-like isoform X2 [Lingula anatina]|nr:cell growth regulator with RING finger domain protein 1-like isoform X2 [Lingula anatina]XP_013387970.1 cell growth regulator with RING finger domain protein 1-like isoform X2 [Lingula anatina]|eukprot:XP_013387969.1 cell growth regulator with RING finger domain protein 1-like isoform X2 [Lingula anatina]